MDNLVILQDNIETEREEGRAEGLAKGKAAEKIAIALAMKNNAAASALIARCTGLTLLKIEKL